MQDADPELAAINEQVDKAEARKSKKRGDSSSDTSQDSQSSKSPKKNSLKKKFADEDDSDFSQKKSPSKRSKKGNESDDSYGKSKSSAKKKQKGKKEKSKRNSSEDESEKSSTDEEDRWSAHDEGVDYGSPEKVSEGEDEWDCRSQELYDSDNPDCPLNAYHIQSKPRLVQIQDKNEKGEQVRLILSFMEIPKDDEQRARKMTTMKLNYMSKKDRDNVELIDHHSF